MRFTKKELKAIRAAIGAMLAGAEHEGNWPEDVDSEDLHSALGKVQGRLVLPAKRTTSEGSK